MNPSRFYDMAHHHDWSMIHCCELHNWSCSLGVSRGAANRVIPDRHLGRKRKKRTWHPYNCAQKLTRLDYRWDESLVRSRVGIVWQWNAKAGLELWRNKCYLIVHLPSLRTAILRAFCDARRQWDWSNLGHVTRFWLLNLYFKKHFLNLQCHVICHTHVCDDKAGPLQTDECPKQTFD